MNKEVKIQHKEIQKKCRKEQEAGKINPICNMAILYRQSGLIRGDAGGSAGGGQMKRNMKRKGRLVMGAEGRALFEEWRDGKLVP